MRVTEEKKIIDTDLVSYLEIYETLQQLSHMSLVTYY